MSGNRFWKPVVVAQAIVALSAAFVFVCRVSAEFPDATALKLPSLAAPVVIDGSATPDEWRGAAKISDFFRLRNGSLMQNAGYAMIALDKDKQNLLLAVVTRANDESATGGLQSRTKQRDDASVWKDDSVEVYLSPASQTIYQLILNSDTGLYDTAVRNGVRDGKWNLRGLSSVSSVENGFWTVELKIPLVSIGSPKNELWLNVARNWTRIGRMFGDQHAQLTETADESLAKGGASMMTPGKSYTDLPSYVHCTWNARPAPTVWMGEIQPAEQGRQIRCPIQFRNTGGKHLHLQASVRTYDGKVVQSVHKTIQNNSTEWIKLPCIPTVHPFDFFVKVSDDAGEILLSRMFPIHTRIPERRGRPIPLAGEKILEKHSVVRVRHYPGLKKFTMETELFHWLNATPVAWVICTARGPGGEIVTQKAKQTAPASWKADLIRNQNTPGSWSLDVAYYDKTGQCLFEKKDVFSIPVKRWEWEGNSIGKSNVVVPPFTPLRVEKGNVVRSILREHTMNDLGLWSQVHALKEDILAGPITLSAAGANDAPISWQRKPLRLIDAKDHKVTFEAQSSAGPLHMNATSTFDYDGMMWVRLALSSDKPIPLDSLTLEIPLRRQHCSLMFSRADYSRGAAAGHIPPGEGTVWDSSGIKKLYLDDASIPMLSPMKRFIPYFWMGGPARGIAWFADCSFGFNLADEKPEITISRQPGGVVRASIDLINRKTIITSEKRIIEFGLLATPVKPRAKGWRAWNILSHPDVKQPVAGGINFSFGPNFSNDVCGGKYPGNYDYSCLAFLRDCNQRKTYDKKELRAILDKYEPSLRAWAKNNREEISRDKKRWGKKWGDDPVDAYVNKWQKNNIKLAADIACMADGFIPYSCPRLEPHDAPEFRYFAAEWQSPHNNFTYLAVRRTFLTPSYIDYLLWYYKKLLDAGATGLYFDEVGIKSAIDPDAETAILGPDGVVYPKAGILATREFLKRVATMMHEHKCDPAVVMLHTTDGMVIPAYSFASAILTWEYKYGDLDFQDRFTSDYILAESTGLQGGFVPFVLPGRIRLLDNPPERTRVTRTALAMQLIHEIKTWRGWDHDYDVVRKAYEILLNFGTAKEDCRFVGYWLPNACKDTGGGDVKISYYRRPGKILLILGNMGNDKIVQPKFAEDITRLGKNPVLYDAETGERFDIGQPRIPLRKHDFRILEIRPAQELQTQRNDAH